MKKLLLLFPIFISFQAMAEKNIDHCQNGNLQPQFRLKACKKHKQKIISNFIDIKKSKKRYSGKPITLEAHYTEAYFIFRQLAEFSGYSLLMDTHKSREVSFNKSEVPWDQALDEIATFLNLKAKILNNIIYIDSPTSLRKYKPKKKRYKGSTLSLNFHEIKAVHLFNVLADFSGNSLLINANLDKKITITRNNVPWNQVLDEVAEFLDLKAKVSNNIIYVDTPKSLWKYKQNNKKYTGSILSLNFLTINIRNLFDILAKFSGHSFVIEPTINEKINSSISIKRINIPWDQALAEIINFLNYKATLSNGIVFIEDNEH